MEKLRNAKLVEIIGVDNDAKNVYKCLRVSYDYMNDQPQGSEAQFILLLCSLFPEDYEIKVEDLTRYAFGMKLFGKVELIEDARRKVRVTIRFLRDSCLLLDVGGEGYAKMHDTVRDVLLWIGGTEPQERNTFRVREGVNLKDLIGKNSFQNCKALSFTSEVIPKFLKHSKLDFPNLEIVLIFIKYDYVELGGRFFEHMKLLKVLDFRAEWKWKWRRRKRMCKFVMPQSLHSLEYLRTLMFRNCECSSSSILGDLGRLRILSLHNCEIDCGVEIVSGLKKLRLLDLSGLETARRMFTSDVKQTLVNLEELYGYTFERWKDKEGTSSRLSEWKLPSNLVAMSVKVEDARCLPTNFCFPNLQSYDIHIGLHADKPSCISQGRNLELCGDIEDESVIINACTKLFPTLQVFRLSHCNDLYSLPASNFLAQGFLQKLDTLEVKSCSNMECVLEVGNVFNSNNSNVQILSLKKLYLYELMKLKHIWKGPTRLVSLCNLTEVQMMEEIFHHLHLEEIFSRGNANDDDDFTCFCCFTNLRELKVSGCHKVKTIFPLLKSTGRAPHRCHLPKLQRIVLQGNGLLEQIWRGPARLASLCNLTEVKIINCPKLICIFSSPSLATSLQQLETLQIERCYYLKEIFSGESDDDDFTCCCCCFTNLRELKMSGCPKVKTIFPLMKSIDRAPHLHPQSRCCRLPKLERIVLEDNKELEHIFGHQTQAEEEVVECPSLPCLDATLPKAVQRIKLSHTQGEDDNEDDNLLISEEVKCIQRGPTQNICFTNLCQVNIIGCHKLKHLVATKIATNLPRLERFIVEDAMN